MTGRIECRNLRGPARLCFIQTMLSRVLDLADPTHVVYEGYALGSMRSWDKAELGGVLKSLVWARGVAILEVPPKSMKSVIALKGNAEKSDINKALKARFGISVNQHDEADAVGLLLVGEMRCGIRTPTPKEGKLDRFKSVRESNFLPGKLQSMSKSR